MLYNCACTALEVHKVKGTILIILSVTIQMSQHPKQFNVALHTTAFNTTECCYHVNCAVHDVL